MPSHDQTTNDDQTTDDDQTTEPRTFDLFELQSQDPTKTFDLNLNEIAKNYGTQAVPVFQWVQKIKVGESTYDERDDVDTKMMKRYEDFVEKYGQPSDMPSPQELLENFQKDSEYHFNLNSFLQNEFI